MKLTKIQNAYIKNKPNYVYLIKDLDGNYIATGHLLNARLKLSIIKHIKTTIDTEGNAVPLIDSYIDFSALWILKSIDKWIISLDITSLIINNLLLLVIVWLVLQIRMKNELSILLVLINEKN